MPRRAGAPAPRAAVPAPAITVTGALREDAYAAVEAATGRAAVHITIGQGAGRPAITAVQLWAATSPASGSHPAAATPPMKTARKALLEALAPQHVLKAEGESPDATDRGVPAHTSPVGGPMGAWQPAAAGPPGDFRCYLDRLAPGVPA